MAFYSYKMTRDYGFAPNPFGGVCTLATCKPHIRKKAEVGDWIIGSGSKKIKSAYYRPIYLMKVTEKITLTDYWDDVRFQFKKPILNGSLVTIHGDNVYTKDENNDWVQAKCQHSHPIENIRAKHIKTDTNGEFVLISDHFYYFGDAKIKVPNQFLDVFSKLRDYSSPNVLDATLCQKFVNWIESSFSTGIHGNPIHWRQYDQLSLF
ncbi:Nmad2 family putative nucleotide modification protein [Runella limosa]|uniref:Nmad2 family putative nucleotide modification protein n=1 Tax=Runella limosa TaxID=370978 RepID=UPI00040AC1B3|nr:hypothetical protein [Runella limosa]